jgi:hypothetical protein
VKCFVTLKLEDHPLSAIYACLFNTFATTLHIWKLFLHLPHHAVVAGTLLLQGRGEMHTKTPLESLKVTDLLKELRVHIHKVLKWIFKNYGVRMRTVFIICLSIW